MNPIDFSPYAARRARLLDRMQAQGGGIAVLPTAPEAARNRDTHYPYRHDSYFYYLSGFTEPDAVVVLIAENGAAMDDLLENGQVHDPVRQDYLKSHIAAVAQARDAGVPVSAYLAWSLLDNYEWGHGYTRRFGICYVDYATQQRIPKRSALWLRDFIEIGRAHV